MGRHRRISGSLVLAVLLASAAIPACTDICWDGHEETYYTCDELYEGTVEAPPEFGVSGLALTGGENGGVTQCMQGDISRCSNISFHLDGVDQNPDLHLSINLHHAWVACELPLPSATVSIDASWVPPEGGPPEALTIRAGSLRVTVVPDNLDVRFDLELATTDERIIEIHHGRAAWLNGATQTFCIDDY